MKTVLVINGESYWQDFFPDHKVVQKKIQTTNWIIKQGKLYVTDTEGTVIPDLILWRVGAIAPSHKQTDALNIIALSNVPCINSAACLIKGFDRLSMLNQLKKLGVPTIDFDVATSPHLLHNIKRDYPFVLKVGNYHGGYGKVLIKNDEQWQEARDFAFVTSHYATTEPFINYTRDIRYLIIGDKVWAMARKGKYWKANVETTSFEQIEPEAEFETHIRNLKKTIGATILAIDILEDETGKKLVVEYNDIPGISGFSDELKYELSACIKQALQE